MRPAIISFGDLEDGEGNLFRDTLLSSLWDKIEVWRSDENNLETAILLDRVGSLTYEDHPPAPGCWWYWGRLVTPAGQVGEFSDPVEVCVSASFVESLMYIVDEAAPFGRRLFFRDGEQFVEFDLAAMLASIPDPQLTGFLGWGMLDNTFYLVGQRQIAVLGFDFLGNPITVTPFVPRYYIFRLNRDPGTTFGGITAEPEFVKTVDWAEVDMGARFTSIVEIHSGSLNVVTGEITPPVDITWPLTFPAHQSYVGLDYQPFLSVDDDGEPQIVAQVIVIVWQTHVRPVPSGWAQVSTAEGREWDYSFVMRPDTGEILFEDSYVQANRDADREAGSNTRIIRWDLRTGGDRIIYVSHFSAKFRWPVFIQYNKRVLLPVIDSETGEPTGTFVPHIVGAGNYGDVFSEDPFPLPFPVYPVSSELLVGPATALTTLPSGTFITNATSYYLMYSVFSPPNLSIFIRDLTTNTDTLILFDDGTKRPTDRIGFLQFNARFFGPGLNLLQPNIAIALPDYGFDEHVEYFAFSTRPEEIHRIVTWPLTPERAPELYGLANPLDPISVPEVPGAQPWTANPDHDAPLKEIPEDLDVTPNDPPDNPLSIEVQVYHAVQEPGDGSLSG